MGTRFINIPASSRLGSFSSQFFFCFFFFSAKMNLTVFAGILLAVTMATARRASLGEKTMQAAGEAEEPEEAMRESARPASLVEKIMRAANKADEPDEAMRAKRGQRMNKRMKRRECTEENYCGKTTSPINCCNPPPSLFPLRASAKADELDEAKRESLGQRMNKRMKQRECTEENYCGKTTSPINCCNPPPSLFPLRASAKADELDEAKRESLDFGKLSE